MIAYLSNEEAGYLAEDLRRVPSFHFWIQDYRKANQMLRHPKKLKKKLRNAPFRFSHADPIGFFADFGWTVRNNINAFEEADRLGRPFPVSFPWNLIMSLIPKARRDQARQAMGYILFEAAQTG